MTRPGGYRRHRAHPGRPRTPLPTYSPELLVTEVMILLAGEGLRGVEVRDQEAADTAAAALLQALGVKPARLPEEEA
ncbi:hypothetical protein [Micromonospora aurantiaca (nom. illeg.)]|uniref:hypothetical protein n=1 Tax=Micromonospora aurantiaca (nom. illeg.) TaxID=47850 RepID=UPI003F4A2003